MKIAAYVFQSPYPSAVQVGRPDPLSSSQENSNNALDALSQTDKQSDTKAKIYKLQVSSSVSVNVAQSVTEPAVKSSLENFSNISKQSQALDAYRN